MYFNTGLQGLQLLPQQNILLTSVAKQQSQLNRLLRHAGDLSENLVDRGDAAAPGDGKYFVDLLGLPF